MARMKWTAIYLCAVITFGCRPNPVHNKLPERDKAKFNPSRGYKNENSTAPDNCEESVENFDGRGNAISDNVLLPAVHDRKIQDLGTEIDDSFSAGVNKVTNLNVSDEENHAGANAQYVEIIQLGAERKEGTAHIQVESHITIMRNASLRSTPNEAGTADPWPKYKTAASGNSLIKLQFPACPTGETIVVESLQEHYLPFGIFSTLMGSLQPAQFPLGVLRDAAERRVPFHVFLLQVLKLEGLALVWILLWAILSLCIPSAAIAQICCPAKKLQRLEDHCSNSTLNLPRSVRFPGCALHTLLIAFMANLILMMSSNEQLTKSIAQSPGMAGMILGDLETFVRNTEMQITFVTVTSFDYALDAIQKDLDDFEILVGVPLQEEFKQMYDLETVFDTLKKIENETLQVSHRVNAMLHTCNLAHNVSKSLQDKLDELIPLLNNIHQQCSERDRPLCETLVSSGLVVTFHVEEILSDVKLKYLARVSADSQLNRTLREAETNYKDMPRRVYLETELQRAEIRNNLQRRRISMHKALRSLEDISRSAISTIKSGSRKLVPILEDIASRDMWRYLAIVGTSIVMFIIWMCLMCGAPCGCENTVRAIPYLIIGLAFACLISLFLWILGSAALLLGLHGQNIICSMLYDPNYEALSDLLDDGGILYPDGGFIKHTLKTNDTIKISEILRKSPYNQSTYTLYKLHSIVNITELLNFNKWPDLYQCFSKFHVDTKNIKILTVSLETYLMDLCTAAKINFVHHRKKMSSSVTAKDLSAYLDQVYTISRKIVDTKTEARLDKLVFKLRDLLKNEYRMLNEYKDTLLYDVTALEVILSPIEEKFQFVLETLRKLQVSTLDDQHNTSKTLTHLFVRNLTSYLEQCREYVDLQITRNVGKSKPLWIIFDATRKMICEQIIDGLNALSFSCYLSIFLLIGLTPVTKRIIKYYREINEDLLSPVIRRNASDETIRRGQTNWGTPPTPSTPETVRNGSEESAWASRRQSIAAEPHIPPPPRPPSGTRRDSSPRVSIRTISRNRSPFSRYDSLKLIERSTWRTPGSPQATSRHWI